MVFIQSFLNMKLYFSYSQIPELAGLTPRRRKLVYQCALEALFAGQPSAVWMGAPWMLGGVVSGALAGWLVVSGLGLAHWPRLVIAAFALAGLVTGIFIATQLLHARRRPYLWRVLEERKDEIARIV
jgi:hypothetical protein